MMRVYLSVALALCAVGLAACGSNDNNGPHATPTATRSRTATPAPTTTPTAAVSRTPTTIATSTQAPSASPTPTSAASATPTSSSTAVDTPAATATPDAIACERGAAAGLLECVAQSSSALRDCYESDGHLCATDAPASTAALDALAASVSAACPDDATVRAVGYGEQFTVAGLTSRLQQACSTESTSLAVRSFGGPQGAALDGADAAARSCLHDAHTLGATLLHDVLAGFNSCLSSPTCSAGDTEQAIAQQVGTAAAQIADACPQPLQSLIAVDTTAFTTRAAAQARCLAAYVHPATAPLALDCGPTDPLPDTPRGEYVQVVLDEATTGTRCGDGSPYAFWIRLAPQGSPIDHVVIGMQGGGVCVFGDDCAKVPADLFEALNDQPETTGPLSNDPDVSPFADWTKVYLPYCTQDVFIGGGATSAFDQVTVERYGALDVRGALHAVRDILWRELDHERAGGYQPDDVKALFGGFSAGGFGTIYNYHWVLDDLQWAHTSAYPDAGLALDNGQPLGVAALGALLISGTPPLGWNSLNFLPPYCFATNCGVGPVLLQKTSPRLKAVPDQQFLILSNQVDQTQVDTTYFDNLPDWVNAMRAAYCATHDLLGVQYFLPAISESVHVISTRNELYTGRAVDGVIMRDWLASGFSSPDTVGDQIEEGTLVTDIPGVQPFPCE